MKPNKIKVGISVGDINGIGLEIICKTFADNRLLNYCTPILFANAKLFNAQRKAINLPEIQFQGIKSLNELNYRKLNIFNVWEEDVAFQFGEPSKIAGEYAFKSLEAATQRWQNGEIDVLLTAPINKDNMHEAGFAYPGHTEYLQHALGESNHLMLMLSDDMKVGLATSHISLKDVHGSLRIEGILDRLKIIQHCLQMDFSINKPKIAVLGLNPHAGENGLLGTEEQQIIFPAIEEAKKQGILAFGPFPADGFFGASSYKKFDAILAMYHDQGLIPFKTLAFGQGVNFTAGLSRIRTSPDHGTGYAIAGKGIANEASFKQALYAALDIFRARTENESLLSNALEIKPRFSERD